MNSKIKALALGLAVLGGTMTIAAVTAPAQAADVVVGVNAGGIAFGYQDGYWDRDHNWHAWRDQQEAAKWREANHDHYYDYKHDRDHDQGWREQDHYWDHH